MSKLVGRLCRVCGKGGKDEEVKEHEKRCTLRDASTSPGLPSSPKTLSEPSSRTSSNTPSGSSSKKPPESSSKTPSSISYNTPSGTLSKTSPDLSSGTQKGSKEKPKSKDSKTRGTRTLDTTPTYSPCKIIQNDNLPINAVRRNSPKQAWNARLPEGVPGKLANPFPRTKSFRYYPVACEFCHQIFSPGAQRKHVQRYHPEDHLPVKLRGRTGGKIPPPSPEDAGTTGTQAAGGIPKHLKICYICGRMFGSKSLSIHEPKCLEKWRLENANLPPNKRRPEPVKLSVSDLENEEPSVSGSGRYANIPDMNAETEAAYRSHLKNLVPCSYCKRTFNPDRIMVHENVCVERAKKRVTKVH